MSSTQRIPPGSIFPRNLVFTVCALSFLSVLLSASPAAVAQSPNPLALAKKLYVAPFKGAQTAQLRQSLIKRLEKNHDYQLVDSAAQADAIVKGSGEVWIRGYFTTNPRAPAANRQAVYGGFLSVEILAASGEPLWSYLATPSKFRWTTLADDLAGSLVNALLIARQDNTAAAAPAGQIALANATLAGAGATFPAPLYRKWFQSFQELHPGVRITYDAVGSEAGSKKLAAGSIDFAASDAILANVSSTVNYGRVPTALGGVVPIYNLPGTTNDLNFTPQLLADIYLGKITRWNDPAIRQSNKGVNLPDRDIIVVHRADGSGTTYLWSDFLSKASPRWKTEVGANSTLQWPIGKGFDGNEGVASGVQATPGSIGYVELVYAIEHQLSFGSVQNSSGEYVRASLESLEEAARVAIGNTSPDALVSITNARGKNAYPIAGFTWLLFPEPISDPAKKAALFELLRWILTSGQKECSSLGYAPLPREIATQQVDLLNSRR